MYGLVIGDNLGRLVEFQTPATIKARYPNGVRELPDGGTHNLAAGQPTDDSEMALALARSINRRGDYDINDVLESYRRWYRSNPFDCGITTGRALSSGELDHASQANGALMRITPIAIAFEPIKAAKAAHQDALLTHPNPYPVAMNMVYAHALSKVLRSPDVTTHWDALYELEEAILYLSDQFPYLKVEFAKIAEDIADMTEYGNLLGSTQNEGWVRIAICALLDELITPAPCFLDALSRQIMKGGDTDTNAAIIGAFLGGLLGMDAIPSHMRETVDHCRPRHNRPHEYHPTDLRDVTFQLIQTARTQEN